MTSSQTTMKALLPGYNTTGTAQDNLHIWLLPTCRLLPKWGDSLQLRHMTVRGKAALQLCSHGSSSTLPSGRLAQPQVHGRQQSAMQLIPAVATTHLGRTAMQRRGLCKLKVPFSAWGLQFVTWAWQAGHTGPLLLFVSGSSVGVFVCQQHHDVTEEHL